ncbi:Hypp677 [Branchiostoma lanceolatum]|uniref:Hypp677 protein n=1 Tax=Branchiostoma lanceolatum TaxID=7740 RepID=A0A8J9VVZ5_BRALA|nr:Hypp677 [Branchiostoma lanceolatum]
MHNDGQTKGPKGLDINVIPAWVNGFTGKGIVATIVDDDLLGNYPVPTLYCSFVKTCLEKATVFFTLIASDVEKTSITPGADSDAIGELVTLFKNKGSRQVCDNYRAIALLSLVGKLFAREKCIEQNKPLLAAFVDLCKEFDSVSREGLYLVLSKIGCPPKLLAIIKAFHDGMSACVDFEGDVSQPFAVNCGVKQGCVLAPTLFGILLSTLLWIAYPLPNEITYYYN